VLPQISVWSRANVTRWTNARIASPLTKRVLYSILYNTRSQVLYGWRLDKQSPGMQQRNRAKLEPQLGPDSAAYTSNCYAAPQKDNYRLLKLWNTSRRDAQHPQCSLFFFWEIRCGCGIETALLGDCLLRRQLYIAIFYRALKFSRK
jgi:hypothetical protein